MAVTDHYASLGVARDADPDVVRAAYRALAKKYHPDSSLDKSPESSRRFRQISEAYLVLSDFEQRARYDESFENAARMQEASTRSSHQANPQAKQNPPPMPAPRSSLEKVRNGVVVIGWSLLGGAVVLLLVTMAILAIGIALGLGH
jgi:curved DNA-binding protein CbpA